MYCSANMKNKLSEFPKKPIDKSFLPATIPKCGSCGGLILDRFILKARKNFIFYQISQRSDDLVLRWLTSRGTPNVSAAPLARNPSGRSALSRTGIFKITTNYYYNVDPLQRCVLPRGLLPQIRHQVRWLPGGHRSQLSGSNQRQTLTEIRVWVLKKPLLRCGELKITFTTSTASSAFSAAGNWWAMQLTHRVVAKLTSWVVAKFTSWVLCFLAALAALYLHG